MRNLWQWLDGKKSTIAMIILFLATFLNEVVIGQWGATADWLPKVISTLNWIGMTLGTVGMGHKAIK
jgi:thiol:disulfide interchange protein